MTNRSLVAVLGLIIVIAIIVIVIAVSNPSTYQNSRELSGNDRATSTATTSESGIPGCGGCVTYGDNGKTLIVPETSRLTIELPESAFDATALEISPMDTMGETFGASSEPGNWVRTFEAVKRGATTTIMVPSKSPMYKDFVITVVITGGR